MHRRTFIAGVGSAAAWPLVARGQQPPMPVVGYLSGDTQDEDVRRTRLQGLGETGYVERKNVAIEYRWAGGQYDQLPALAASSSRRRDCHDWWRPSDACGKGSHLHDTDRFWHRPRSGRTRARCEPQSTPG